MNLHLFDNHSLVGCDTALLGEWFPIFQRTILSSNAIYSFKTMAATHQQCSVTSQNTVIIKQMQVHRSYNRIMFWTLLFSHNKCLMPLYTVNEIKIEILKMKGLKDGSWNSGAMEIMDFMPR